MPLAEWSDKASIENQQHVAFMAVFRQGYFTPGKFIERKIRCGGIDCYFRHFVQSKIIFAGKIKFFRALLAFSPWDHDPDERNSDQSKGGPNRHGDDPIFREFNPNASQSPKQNGQKGRVFPA